MCVLLAAKAAAITVDGAREVAYGGALAVQTIDTGFGDNKSEWNAGYGVIQFGKVYLMFTGNLEDNFNKLEVFIDSYSSGSSNVLSTIGNDGAGSMNGMTFDTGFTPDYHFIFRRGFDTPNNTFDVDFASLNPSGVLIVNGNSPGPGKDIFSGDLDGNDNDGVNHDVAGLGLEIAYDNSNTAGIGENVGAAADQTAAAAVTTGLELGINLADLNYAGGPIRVMLLQNNQGHSYASNQTLGGLPVGYGNLSDSPPLSNRNFSDIGGDQYFTVVPEPISIALIGSALAAIVGGMRWRK